MKTCHLLSHKFQSSQLASVKRRIDIKRICKIVSAHNQRPDLSDESLQQRETAFLHNKLDDVSKWNKSMTLSTSVV